MKGSCCILDFNPAEFYAVKLTLQVEEPLALSEPCILQRRVLTGGLADSVEVADDGERGGLPVSLAGDVHACTTAGL
jgi:hypothetical protein